MADIDTPLMAHLMRRAGFGAPYEEVEARAAKGYEETVEELLNPEEQPDMEYDIMLRYRTSWLESSNLEDCQALWTYRLINTKRPLEEKMILFWHSVLCTGHSKCNHARQQLLQLDMFRLFGMGSFPNLLLELSKDPAMVFFLDNCMSHKDAINENYGRELLELFSMGVGMDGHPNYTEDDVKACARAFTGWTISNAIPQFPYGRYASQFLYNSEDHDEGEKTFLDESGRWNGENVVEMIAKQPATARFISRHLYNFFVADEAQVPAWQNTPPTDPDAIKVLEDAYFQSSCDIRSMLRVLFNSDFFKEARFAKVKSPAEAVVGIMRLVGDFTFPKPGLHYLAMEPRFMGQDLLNPPTVEGWHTGKEWIDSGTLVERVNFSADQLGNVNLPGVRYIIDKVGSEAAAISAERLVDRCLEMLGSYELGQETRGQLVAHAQRSGELRTGTQEFGRRVGQMLQLIAATQEYQFG